MTDDAIYDPPTGAEFMEAPVVLRKRDAVEAEMDITPMIDCVFLLLVFFVVTSNLENQSAIELAKARHGKGVGERESVIISVGEGGVDEAPVFLADGAEGEPLPEDDAQQREMIKAAIEEAMREEAKNDVIIKADRNVAHRDVATVIKAVSQVEGVNIHLAVLESD